MQESPKDLRRLSEEELRTYLESIGEPAYRARQIREWLWEKAARDIDSMTNLSRGLRQKLSQDFVLQPATFSKVQRSEDGTLKNAVRLHDGLVVESVLIPTSTRTTACVSSQVGCALDCQFCATARLKRQRNLSAGEIFDQVALIGEQSRSFFGRPLSNIVFMGMGEPLLNYDEVLEAIRRITAPDGLGMAPRRITVSTVGLPKQIRRLALEPLGFGLAVSLHSAIDAKRSQIMPVNRTNPLSELMEALQEWYRLTGRRITFEYVVWKGFNDRLEDALALRDYCRKVPSKVNLIEYNAIGDPRFEQADPDSIQRYVEVLEADGTVVKIRRSRGRDIDAACGQLANRSLDEP
ncbi:23S rRNA (adenine(2503)-C(2))-methyltransferase RlmN [bacterium]|nr:23S rRNA (adenine(2503)-C(2))-methyltransferase RlmN [bacterium]